MQKKYFMQTSKPLLSIIIVSYNTSKLTISCIKSILQDSDLKNGNIPFEIIIIDNNSKDDSVAKIENLNLNNLHLIKNSNNPGFGFANNQGFKIAKGQYLLLLNSDTLITNSSISQCLTWLSSHPDCACVSPQLLNTDGSIQETGGYFPNFINILAWRTHLDDLPFFNKIIKPFHPHGPNFYTKDDFYTKDQVLDWLTGAFILTRKSILNKVKGFDETFFMYAEEVDLQYRIKQAFPSLYNQYLSGPKIIHHRGASAKNKSDILLQEKKGIKRFFEIHKPQQLPFLKPFLI